MKLKDNINVMYADQQQGEHLVFLYVHGRDLIITIPNQIVIIT